MKTSLKCLFIYRYIARVYFGKSRDTLSTVTGVLWQTAVRVGKRSNY